MELKYPSLEGHTKFTSLQQAKQFLFTVLNSFTLIATLMHCVLDELLLKGPNISDGIKAIVTLLAQD